MLINAKLVRLAVVFFSATAIPIQLNQQKHEKIKVSLSDFRNVELNKLNELKKIFSVPFIFLFLRQTVL